jgi:hypothetical protein
MDRFWGLVEVESSNPELVAAGSFKIIPVVGWDLTGNIWDPLDWPCFAGVGWNFGGADSQVQEQRSQVAITKVDCDQKELYSSSSESSSSLRQLFWEYSSSFRGTNSWA